MEACELLTELSKKKIRKRLRKNIVNYALTSF